LERFLVEPQPPTTIAAPTAKMQRPQECMMNIVPLLLLVLVECISRAATNSP
jgi:hypothetical protein